MKDFAHLTSFALGDWDLDCISSDEDEEDVDWMGPPPRHKMDVIRSRQVDVMMKGTFFVWFFCIMYVSTAAVLANVVFLRHESVAWDANSPPLRVRTVAPSRAFFAIELAINLICAIVIVLLAVVYPIRVLFRNKHPVTHEQVWVILNILSNALIMSPLLEFVLLYSHTTNVKNYCTGIQRHSRAIQVWEAARSIGSGMTTIFFLWGMAQVYRQLYPLEKKREHFQFYIPKIIPLLVYALLRLVTEFQGDVRLSEIPFSNLIGLMANSFVARRSFPKATIFICIISTFEFYFLLCIVYSFKRTAKVLSDADYLKYRSKQIGYRFFIFNNVFYYSLFFVFDLVQTLAVPRHTVLRFLLCPNRPILTLANAEWGGFSYQILNCAYLFIAAYCHLPYDSKGLRGWFWSPRLEDLEDDFSSQKISLTTKEPSSLSLAPSCRNRNNNGPPTLKKETEFGQSLDTRLHSTSLCLPLHIGLFNFAWLAYDWGRNGVLAENEFGWLEQRNLVVKDHIYDPSTDSSIIIVSAIDRIVIAFKGTTSTQNMKTDANARRTGLSTAFPTYPSEHEMLKSDRFLHARVHRGFLQVYSSLARRVVDCIADLIASKKRPVMLTGHSLGGALATICSLDLRASLNLEEANVVVSTFGSPRVGNEAWAELYDEHIPKHWRFTVERDIITTLPKFGYKHVGKRVLLMISGNLFLDPTSVEGILWSGDLPEMLYHKKTAYMHCIATFCTRFTDIDFDFWGCQLGHEDRIMAEVIKVSEIDGFGDQCPEQNLGGLVKKISQMKSDSYRKRGKPRKSKS